MKIDTTATAHFTLAQDARFLMRLARQDLIDAVELPEDHHFRAERIRVADMAMDAARRILDALTIE